MESVFSDGRQRGFNVFHGADDEGKPSGAANLTDPYACRRIIDDLPAAMDRYGIASIEELRGGR